MHTMNRVLEICDKYSFIYLDDIMVYLWTHQKYVKYINDILVSIKAARRYQNKQNMSSE
jgi:hypothetical protein